MLNLQTLYFLHLVKRWERAIKFKRTEGIATVAYSYNFYISKLFLIQRTTKCTIFFNVTSSSLVEVRQISDEYNACIFGTEDWAKQEASKKSVASSMFLGNISELPPTTQCYIPESGPLHSHHCENLKPNNIYIWDTNEDVNRNIYYDQDKKFIPSGHENHILIITVSWSSNAQTFLWPLRLYFHLFIYCRKNNVLICFNFISCNWKTYGHSFHD